MHDIFTELCALNSALTSAALAPRTFAFACLYLSTFEQTRSTRNTRCFARATSILSHSVGRCVRRNMHTSDKQLDSTNRALSFCSLDYAPIALIIMAVWAVHEGTRGIRAMCCVLCGFRKRRKLSHLSESERCDEFPPLLRGAYAEIGGSVWLKQLI